MNSPSPEHAAHERHHAMPHAAEGSGNAQGAHGTTGCSSLAVTLGHPGEALWWELASLTTHHAPGHWIEMRSISQASGALRELARLLPSTAQRLVGETIEDVAISVLRDGDLVLVRPGASHWSSSHRASLVRPGVARPDS